MTLFCSINGYMCFFFNDKATTEIYTYGHTLSLHDALPILAVGGVPAGRRPLPWRPRPPLAARRARAGCSEQVLRLRHERHPARGPLRRAAARAPAGAELRQRLQRAVPAGGRRAAVLADCGDLRERSEEHTSELQSLL